MADTVTTTQASDEAPRWRKPAKQRTSWLLTVICLLLAAYFLLPLFWLVVASTKTNDDLFSSFGLWFARLHAARPTSRNLFTAQDGVYLRWLRNTCMYAVVSAVGAALARALGGYGFAKYRFRGQQRDVRARPRRDHGADHGAGHPDLPAVPQGRAGRHTPGRSSCRRWSARSGST